MIQRSLQLSVTGSSRIRAGFTDDPLPPPPPPLPHPLPHVLFLLLLLSGPLLSLSRGSASPPVAFHRVLPRRSGAAVCASCDGGGPLKKKPLPTPPPSAAEDLDAFLSFFEPALRTFSPPALLCISLGMPPDWSRSGTHPNPTGAPLTHDRRLFEGCLRAKMKEN